MIYLKQVSKAFGKQVVLNQINLHLTDNKTYVLLGLSGSGKSTLLKLLLGQEKVTSGEVSVLNQPPENVLEHIGYFPQDSGLFPHLTAYENISIAARIYNKPATETKERVEDLCNFFQIDRELLKLYPSQLSGGQKQRIALARSLFLDPEILIFDEALTALDPILRKKLQEEMKELFSTLKKLVLFVTHDVTEAAYLADEIILLRDGYIEQRGSFRELYKNPRNYFVSDFLSSSRDLKEYI